MLELFIDGLSTQPERGEHPRLTSSRAYARIRPLAIA